jgi:hypothetical protein
VLDNLGMNSSCEWLAALLAEVLPEIYTGIKIPTNPADCLRTILAMQWQFPAVERLG